MSVTDDVLAQLANARTAIDTATALMKATPTATVTPVKVGDNLLAILAAAPADAVFSLDPAFVLEADVTFAKPVTLMSAADGPGSGAGRVSQTMAGPILRGAHVATAPNVHFFGMRLEGKVPGSTILTSGSGTLLDRCVLLGTALGQHRGVRADSVGVQVLRTAIQNIWASADAQAIAAWDGCRNLLVDDCYLEASGENVLFGGADCASEAGIPQDIEILNSTLFKPLGWIGRVGLTAKNLFETKCVKRLHVNNCHLENSWVNGQDGYAMLINVRNQDGAAPWSTVEDVTVENCSVVNCVSGIEILGRDYTHPSKVMTRVMLRNLTFGNIGKGWVGGASGGREVFISGGPQNLSLVGLTFAGAIEPEGTALTFDTPDALLSGLTVTDCRFLEGFYGIHGTGAPALGKAVLDMYAPGYVWKNNVIVKGSNTAHYPILYPDGTVME